MANRQSQVLFQHLVDALALTHNLACIVPYYVTLYPQSMANPHGHSMSDGHKTSGTVKNLSAPLQTLPILGAQHIHKVPGVCVQEPPNGASPRE